jgi:hypothetical protein
LDALEVYDNCAREFERRRKILLAAAQNILAYEEERRGEKCRPAWADEWLELQKAIDLNAK